MLCPGGQSGAGLRQLHNLLAMGDGVRAAAVAHELHVGWLFQGPGGPGWSSRESVRADVDPRTVLG